MTRYLEFAAGAISENIPWRIEFDATVHVKFANICHHCHSERLEPVSQGYPPEPAMTCPRVVIAFNEAGYSATEVCLDCILEAASAIEAATAVETVQQGSTGGESAVAKPDAHTLA